MKEMTRHWAGRIYLIALLFSIVVIIAALVMGVTDAPQDGEPIVLLGWMTMPLVVGVFFLIFWLAAYGYKISAKTAEDYMLGGRTIGVVVMFFFVLFAISPAWTFYGFPGLLYTQGPGGRVHLNRARRELYRRLACV